MVLQTLDWSRWGEPIRVAASESVPVLDGPMLVEVGDHEIPIRLMNTTMDCPGGYLLVVLNAAIRHRESTKPPFFSGEGLSKSYRGPILSISDLGTHVENVNLAWYAGVNGFESLQQELAAMIMDVAKQFSAKPLLLGSSGGGFAALSLSLILGKEATALVMNPQTDFFRYHPGAVERYLSSCYNLPRNPSSQALLEEMGVITSVQNAQFDEPRVLMFQNMLDSHHLTNHFRFLATRNHLKDTHVGQTNGIDWLVGPWGFGHQRVWPEHVILGLEGITGGESNAAIIERIEKEFYPSSIETGQSATSLSEANPSFPMLNTSDGRTVNIGKCNFNDSTWNASEIHGWKILEPLLLSKTPSRDHYRALYFILDWAKWADGVLLDGSVGEERFVKSRVKILESFLSWVGEVPAMGSHIAALERLLDVEISRLSND